MTEEEFEDRLGLQHGMKPLGYPRWPLILPGFAWLAIIIGLVWFLVHLYYWIFG